MMNWTIFSMYLVSSPTTDQKKKKYYVAWSTIHSVMASSSYYTFRSKSIFNTSLHDCKHEKRNYLYDFFNLLLGFYAQYML